MAIIPLYTLIIMNSSFARSTKTRIAKTYRSLDKICHLDYDIVYKTCESNIADYFSRNHPEDTKIVSVITESKHEWTDELLAGEIEEDEILKHVLHNLRDKKLSRDESLRNRVENVSKKYVWKNQRRYNVWKDEETKTTSHRLAIPPEKATSVLERLQNTIFDGHFGKLKTWAAIMKAFYWKGMHKDTIEFEKNCKICQR